MVSDRPCPTAKPIRKGEGEQQPSLFLLNVTEGEGAVHTPVIIDFGPGDTIKIPKKHTGPDRS